MENKTILIMGYSVKDAITGEVFEFSTFEESCEFVDNYPNPNNLVGGNE